MAQSRSPLKLRFRTPKLFAEEGGVGLRSASESGDVELAGLGRVEAIEFGFHETHVLLLGEFALGVCGHERKELFDGWFGEVKVVLRLGKRGFLRGSGEKKETGNEQGREEKDGGED